MDKIFASVGKQGQNRPNDTKVIQNLLNKHKYTPSVSPLSVDGLIGPKTISRIEAFQKQHLKMIRPDARVDPNGRTLKALIVTKTIIPVSHASMTFSSKGKNLLKEIEVLKLQPYDDQTGKEISEWIEGATIGYGHLISKTDWELYKNGINKETAETLFGKDLLPFVNCVKQSVTASLTQNQFDALVIFTYNIGITAFKKSSVLKLLNNPTAITPYSSIEAAWKAWNKSQGQVMTGLVNRRKSEWNIYSKGIYVRW